MIKLMLVLLLSITNVNREAGAYGATQAYLAVQTQPQAVAVEAQLEPQPTEAVAVEAQLEPQPTEAYVSVADFNDFRTRVEDYMYATDDRLTRIENSLTRVEDALNKAASVRQSTPTTHDPNCKCGPNCKCVGECKCRWPGECLGLPRPLAQSEQPAKWLVWTETVAAGKNAADRNHLPSFVFWSQNECAACEEFDQKVLQDPEVVQFLAAHFNCIRDNGSYANDTQKDRWQLGKKYDTAYPQCYVVYPNWDQGWLRLEKDMDPKVFLKTLQATIDHVNKKAKTKLGSTDNKGSADIQTVQYGSGGGSPAMGMYWGSPIIMMGPAMGSGGGAPSYGSGGGGGGYGPSPAMGYSYPSYGWGGGYPSYGYGGGWGGGVSVGWGSGRAMSCGPNGCF